MARTTISITEVTRDELYYMKDPDESYEDYIRRKLIDD